MILHNESEVAIHATETLSLNLAVIFLRSPKRPRKTWKSTFTYFDSFDFGRCFDDLKPECGQILTVLDPTVLSTSTGKNWPEKKLSRSSALA